MSRDKRDRESAMHVLLIPQSRASAFDELMMGYYQRAGIESGSALSRKTGLSKEVAVKSFAAPRDMSFYAFRHIRDALGIDWRLLSDDAGGYLEYAAVASRYEHEKSRLVELGTLWLGLDDAGRELLIDVAKALARRDSTGPANPRVARVLGEQLAQFGERVEYHHDVSGTTSEAS